MQEEEVKSMMRVPLHRNIATAYEREHRRKQSEAFKQKPLHMQLVRRGGRYSWNTALPAAVQQTPPADPVVGFLGRNLACALEHGARRRHMHSKYAEEAVPAASTTPIDRLRPGRKRIGRSGGTRAQNI